MAEAANEARRELWDRGTPRFALERKQRPIQFANKMLSLPQNTLLTRTW